MALLKINHFLGKLLESFMVTVGDCKYLGHFQNHQGCVLWLTTGLRGSGAGTLGVPLGGTRRVGGLLGVAGRLSAEPSTSLFHLLQILMMVQAHGDCPASSPISSALT